jgi:hypothetical protein
MTDEIQSKLQTFVDDAMKYRAETIDAFCKAYLSSRADWFMEKPERITRLVLCEKQDGLKTIYWFEIKRGKLKH